jgi:hypothetical protein
MPPTFGQKKERKPTFPFFTQKVGQFNKCGLFTHFLTYLIPFHPHSLQDTKEKKNLTSPHQNI